MTALSSRVARPKFIAAAVAAAVIVASVLVPAARSAGAADAPLRSDGEFLTGWYDTLSGSARLPAIRAEGMNTVMPYHETGGDVIAYLDAAREAGVKVFVEIDRAIVRAGDAEAIRDWVAQYKTHPAVSGWYLADEPSINPTLGPLSAATAELLYEAVKAEDPAHPVAIAFSTSDDISAYSNAHDIAMWDDYPARVGQAEFTGMDVWKYRLQQRAASTAGKQGFIPIIQAFTTGLTGPTQYYRLPTPAEARYMTYSAVQAGATGIFYWTRYRSTFSFIENAVKPLTSELTRLGPALKRGALAGVASVSQGPGVVARAYRDPSTGRYSVVVVNHSAQQVNAALSITPSLATAAQPVGGTLTQIVNGTLVASLQPYEARTYDLSSAPTISDVANQNLDEDTPKTVAITAGDDRTAPESLVLTARSSDQTLLPDANIVVGGSGVDRSLTITPAEDLSGTAAVTLTLTDGDTMTATDTFDVTVAPVNDAPTVSNIADRSTAEDTASAPIAFTLGDIDGGPDSVNVSGSSSNTALVPNANIVFEGQGAERTVVPRPALNASGTSTITITADDGEGGTASRSFALTVTAVNDAPTTTNIADNTTSDGTATAAIPFTIGDAESSATALTVSGSSSNTGLVSNSKMVFGGTGANRTVKITPNAGYSGTATISVRVTDPSGATTTDIFVLTVTPRSSTTFAVSNASIVEGHSGTRYMAFTITRSGASTMARVNFATSYGTANRYDFSSIKGTAMFVGSTKEILVPIKGDRTVEPNDTLLLTLSSPSYASITVGSGIGTIVNDD